MKTHFINKPKIMQKTSKVVMMACAIAMMVFLTGCQESDNVEQHNSSSVSEKLDNFEALVSGKVIYPKDMELTDKMKQVLLETAEGVGDINIKVGKIPVYSKEDLIRHEETGRTNREEEDRILELIESDSQSSQKIQKRSSRIPRYGFVTIPHYYQYDSSENPNANGWCGHTVLKSVAHKHGSFKTLQQIHTAFWNNSAEYRHGRCNGNHCASLLDLKWAANNQNRGHWNYNFSTSDLEKIYSIDSFYQRIQDGVNHGKPMILPSSFGYGSSLSLLHFYPVVGYVTIYDHNGSIDYDKSKVYVRDVAMPNPGRVFERNTSVRNFYNHMSGNQVLFVRPGFV